VHSVRLILRRSLPKSRFLIALPGGRILYRPFFRSPVVDNQSQGRSVSRVLSPPNGGRRSFIWTSRCRLALPPRGDLSPRRFGMRPTRRSCGPSRTYPGRVWLETLRTRGPRSPSSPTGCLVLQAVGFSLPATSPPPRCALTAPFHHCPIPPALRAATPGRRLCVFCGTIPGIAPGGR